MGWDQCDSLLSSIGFCTHMCHIAVLLAVQCLCSHLCHHRYVSFDVTGNKSVHLHVVMWNHD